MQKITGFGEPDLCPLCEAACYDCQQCIYADRYGPTYVDYCWHGQYSKSYFSIVHANSYESLLAAVKERAVVIRGRLRELEMELKKRYLMHLE